MNVNLDEDALFAAADLVGRTGAKELQIGYLHDDVPAAEAGWYAYAQYKGARITEEGAGPIEAAEGLARKVLTGGKCTKCGGLIALSGSGAVAFRAPVMADGSTWTAEDAAKAGQCRWTGGGGRPAASRGSDD